MSSVLATQAIRDTAINAAVAAGRITEATRPSYERLYASAPTDALIALAAVPPPTSRVSLAAQDPPTVDPDDYPASWLTCSEREAVAAARGGVRYARMTLER